MGQSDASHGGVSAFGNVPRINSHGHLATSLIMRFARRLCFSGGVDVRARPVRSNAGVHAAFIAVRAGVHSPAQTHSAEGEAMKKKHPGFEAVAKHIAMQPGIRNAGAVLAASTRKASAKAKKKNPRLKRVR